ncbi:uncharacterized protein METZ01_LOCUS339190, partial [marine metagenome]
SPDLSVSSYGGTLADAAGGACGAASGDLGAVIVDGDTPDISGADATDAAYGVGEVLSITVTFDEAVTVTGTPTITLSNADVASYASGSTTTAIVFTTTIAQGDTTSSDLSVSSIQPTAGGATMKDGAGNAISTTVTGGDLGTVTVDGAVPVFSSCAATDDDYGVGDVLTITCTWGEAVVTSDGTLTLDNADIAAYSSGSGTTALVFTTTIAEGDTTDTDVAVSAYGGTIADSAGGAAGAASGDLGDVSIDGDAPDLASVAATDGAYGVGDVLTITVTWDEACIGTSATLTLSNSDVAAYSSGSGTTALVFTTTIAENDATSADLSVSSYS